MKGNNLWILLLVAGIIVMLVLNLLIGSVNIPLRDVLDIISGRGEHRRRPGRLKRQRLLPPLPRGQVPAGDAEGRDPPGQLRPQHDQGRRPLPEHEEERQLLCRRAG